MISELNYYPKLQFGKTIPSVLKLICSQSQRLLQIPSLQWNVIPLFLLQILTLSILLVIVIIVQQIISFIFTHILLNNSQLFIPHGYKMLVVLDKLVLLFLVDYRQVIELVLGRTAPRLLLHTSHILNYRIKTPFYLLRAIPQSPVIKSSMVFQ